MSTHPVLVMGMALVLCAGLIAQLPKLTFDASSEGFLQEDDPVRVDFQAFQQYFGRSEQIVLAIRLPERLGDAAFLAKLQALHEDLEVRVPHVSRVTSLINVRHMEARGDELHIGNLVEELPSSPAELAAFERKVRESRLYPNVVLSPDERWTLVSLESDLYVTESGDLLDFESEAGEQRLLGPLEDAEMIAAVERIVAEYQAPGFELRTGGGILVEDVLRSAVRVDFVRLLLVAIGVIAVLLYLVFRSAMASLLVISVVVLSLLGTIGGLAATGTPVGLGTQILPTFLLAVGVGYAVHILTLFRQRQAAGSARREAAAAAVDHAGRPIVLTALTTVAGLVSFAPADLVPVAQIGIFAPIGVFLAAIFSLTLLPALLVLLPIPAPARTIAPSRAQRGLVAAGQWATGHRGVVLATLVALILVSALGMTRLRTSHDPLSWLHTDPELLETIELVDTQLGGAGVLELLIEAPAAGGLRDPELLQRMDAAESRILELEVGPVRAGKVLGLNRVVKELNQALHEGDPGAYFIPDDPRLVAQEIMLFENSGVDDVEEMADSTFTVGRLGARITWDDAYYVAPFAERMLAEAQQEISGLGTVRLGGLQALVSRAFVAVNETMKMSYAIAFVVVTLLLVFVVGDVRVGLVAMIPNVAPIIIALGFMGWAGIPIGTLTLLVGSIALGLVVDDTIHFAHGFVRYERECGTARQAIGHTLRTTGVALLFTSTVLVCGFLVYGLGSLVSMFHFGLVAAVAIITALLADLLVLPVLLVWLFEPARGAVERIPYRSRLGVREGGRRLEWEPSGR